MMSSCIIYIRYVDLCQVQFYNEVGSINDHRFVTVFDCHQERIVAVAGLCICYYKILEVGSFVF